MTSTVYPLSVTAASQPIAVTTNIFASSVTITEEMLRWGGGGILRLYFSFNLDATTGIIGVFKGGNFVGNLNADNSSEITDNGYYRFDIDVQAGDIINLQLDAASTSTEITTVLFVRAHLVLVGA